MQFPQYQPPPHEGLDIAYQDDSLLIVNKPSGLLATPGRGEDKQDCLISRVQQAFPTAEIVHRLDMATSGLMLIALNKSMQREMSILFQQRQVQKIYIAVVEGIIESDEGSVDLPMMTDWPNRPLQMIDHEKGKAALTHYRVLERDMDNNLSRVELKPVTGRTHQLRLHMQAMGHAIMGDNLYSSSAAASRLLLHATSLEFIHPITAQSVNVFKPPVF